MKFYSLIVTLFLFVSCQENKVGKMKILFFGDSITEAGVKPKGYIDQIQEYLNTKQLQNDYALVGKGISGNKVYDLYLRLDKDVLAENPQKVIIWIGVNDVWHKPMHGTGTDADRFIKFYDAIIEKLKAQNIEVFVCTPAVVGERKDKQNELDAPLDEFSNMIREIATKHKVTLIDLRTLVNDYLQTNNTEDVAEGILTYDGVHLSDLGNQMIAQWMIEKILP